MDIDLNIDNYNLDGRKNNQGKTRVTQLQGKAKYEEREW